MNVIDQIQHRRSIRVYKKDPIPENILQDIMDAAVAAPSGVNLQPWYYVVIHSPEERENIRDLLRDMAFKVVPELKERFAKYPEVVEETCNFMMNLGGAPVAVLVFRYRDSYTNHLDTITQSIGAGIENLLLAADSYGIGSCWMTAPVETGIAREFEKRYAEGHGKMIAMVALGYPDQEPRMPKRKEGRVRYI